MEEQYNNLKIGERGAWVSIIAYLTLSALKLIIGYLSNSEALMADGLNNTTDIIVSVAVLIGLRFSRKPPDEDHPYGHWRAETIASLMASFIMMVVGMQVLYNAGRSIVDFRAETPDALAAWTAVGCALVMYGVYRFNCRLALRINSQAMMAAAKDNLLDAWVSIGAAVGIFGSQFGMPWLDPLAAVVVGFMICRTAWEIFRDATHNLTDGFDEQKLMKLRQTIEEIPGVKALNDIKARVHGNNVLVDVVIYVDPDLNVIESHHITEAIEKRMQEEHGIISVHVHVEPWEK